MHETHNEMIDRKFREGKPIDEALQRGVRQALRMHKRLGNPIAVWQDNRVVWIQPEDIPDYPEEPVTPPARLNGAK